MTVSKYTQPQIGTSALVTVDVQNDFTLKGAPAEIEGTEEAVPQMVRSLEAFRAKGLPIFHMVRLYARDGSDAERCRKEAFEKGGQIVTPGTTGAELVDALMRDSNQKFDSSTLRESGLQQIGEHEYLLYKPRWGAFFKTRLESLLEKYECDTLFFCGCNYPNCPRTSLYEASERDFRVALITDAVSQLYEKGENEMNNIGVHLVKTSELEELVT